MNCNPQKRKGPGGAGPQFSTAFERLYGKRQQFNKTAGIDPAEYYARELKKLHIRGEWADAVCPLHADSNPSLSVNLKTGGFYCHGCQASGGDVIDFARQRYGLGYREACKALGVPHG